MSGAEFLELLAEEEGNGDDRATVHVTVYFDDTPVKDRAVIEDPLSDYVESTGLGEWVGSGQGDLGEGPFFDVTFAVEDLEAALAALRKKLVELGAGPKTELSSRDGVRKL